MPKRSPRAEMPFLDHLEELRWRILWSLLAVAIGAGVGYALLTAVDVIGFLKAPIAGHLPDGRLAFTSPAEPFLITLKIAVALGVVLASPVLLWQAWAFLAPALYAREKRVIVPVLIIGLFLFLGGATVAYYWVLPTAIRLLFGVHPQDFTPVITAPAYFTFALRLILAFGIVTELPLLLTLLAAFGVVTSRGLRRNRRWALLVGAVLAAFLTPPDAVSMLMMLGPVMVLYEASVWAAWVIERRRARAAASAAVVLLLLAAAPAAPAVGQAAGADTAARGADTARGRQALDTAVARRLGLPTQPGRTFPMLDSVMETLMGREGFETIRYRADSVTLFARDRQVQLRGAVRLDRGTAVLEADSVRYFDESCLVAAYGRPALFDAGTVLVGERMRYDACANRGTVRDAITDFDQSGVTWYLRGQLALDSNSTRIFAASSRVTSCELPTPHYHFHARELKWITGNVFVARPAVLYIRDVPILWLPFIFQDIRSGRRSGVLVPRFGINDLVRPSRSYQRHVSGLGYYWAMSNYTDLRVSLDWFSNRYTAITAEFNYHWLDRFLQGGVRVTRQQQANGSASTNLQWSHRQTFSSRSSLVASVNYASNTQVVERNAVDPTNLTATIDSRVNYNRGFGWGRVDIGGSRTQSITDPSVSQTLPTIAVAPTAINLGPDITWSPSFRLSNTQDFRQAAGTLLVPGAGGTGVDTVSVLADTRRTAATFNTPIRVGAWNWSNSISMADFRTNRRSVSTALAPDSSTQLVTVFGEDFSTGVDWTTGVGLPALFRSSWRLQPSVTIQNATTGPFLLRNRNTGGAWVSQGKRLAFGASVSPTLFGFFPGVGPIARIRHSISPSLAWQYAPSATVPEDYARAADPTGRTVGRRSDTQQQLTLSLSQTFEGKFAPEPGDTAADPRDARKLKLLQIATSGLTYDFEQAAKPGRTGWTTQSLSNTLTSDLLRGFSVTLTHDLWAGTVGVDTTRFDPFLTSVSARASVTAATFGGLLGLLGIGPDRLRPRDLSTAPPPTPDTARAQLGAPLGPRYTTLDRMLPTTFGQRGFAVDLTFDASRQRPGPEGGPALGGARRNLGISLAFSPTRNWSAAWNTTYDLERGTFDQQVIRLDRDLHRWRASFSFVKLANGNFIFNFSVSLKDQPEIQFDYDQQTFER